MSGVVTITNITDVILEFFSQIVAPNFSLSDLSVGSKEHGRTVEGVLIYNGVFETPPINTGSVRIYIPELNSGISCVDDGNGNLVGLGISGTVDYVTGAFQITLDENPTPTDERKFYRILADYSGPNKLKFTYTPELTYLSGFEDRRSWKSRLDSNTRLDLPIFLWNRGTLQLDEDLKERGRVNAYTVRDSEQLNTFEVAYSTLELRFAYADRIIQEMEKFELIYLTQISKISSFIVDYGPEIGEYEYEIQFSALDEMQIERKPVFFHMLPATVKILGPFFVATGTHPRLKEIIVREYFMYSDEPFIHDENPFRVTHIMLNKEETAP